MNNHTRLRPPLTRGTPIQRGSGRYHVPHRLSHGPYVYAPHDLVALRDAPRSTSCWLGPHAPSGPARTVALAVALAVALRAVCSGETRTVAVESVVRGYLVSRRDILWGRHLTPPSGPGTCLVSLSDITLLMLLVPVHRDPPFVHGSLIRPPVM